MRWDKGVRSVCVWSKPAITDLMVEEASLGNWRQGKLECGEELAMQVFGERSFQAERAARTKAISGIYEIQEASAVESDKYGGGVQETR